MSCCWASWKWHAPAFMCSLLCYSHCSTQRVGVTLRSWHFISHNIYIFKWHTLAKTFEHFPALLHSALSQTCKWCHGARLHGAAGLSFQRTDGHQWPLDWVNSQSISLHCLPLCTCVGIIYWEMWGKVWESYLFLIICAAQTFCIRVIYWSSKYFKLAWNSS